MRLTELKGIGEKTEELFSKLGVHSVEELLAFFPRDYETFSDPVCVNELEYKSFASVKGVFLQGVFERRAKNLTITQADFADEIGAKIKVSWFNAPYIKKNVLPAVVYIIRGRVRKNYGRVSIDQPRVYTEQEYLSLRGKYLPIYSLTKGLTNNIIIKAVKQALNDDIFSRLDIRETVPAALRKRYGLLNKKEIYHHIHFPTDRENYALAVKSAAFEEIFLYIYLMKQSENTLNEKSDLIIPSANETKRFIASLPFSLTQAQVRVIDEINRDMCSGKLMNRLIQGDVGSGKTMTALVAMMNAAYSGYQSALMAPTEVLARQHYENINNYFRSYGIKLNAALLTGSLSALEKKVIYDALKNGRIDIIIGTHALIQKKVEFKDLALVVTDEQHRFGTKQREGLALKSGSKPHMMVMSATPIPRTLALILYGGMDVSTIDQLPKGRLPIKNAVVDSSYHENVFRFITKQVREGRQVYVICPLVEYSEGLDAENVQDHAAMLKEKLDPSFRIATLTGPMPLNKKNEVMEKWASGEIDILVSTTVVEVGVDVANASTMVIEDAHRFGLAALHQLRGRVGRGPYQSYCIFISNDRSEQAMERLNILKQSNNGFDVACRDLQMRGPGELTGERQSGELSFKVFDLLRDMDIAEKAAESAADILSGAVNITNSEREILNAECESINNGLIL